MKSKNRIVQLWGAITASVLVHLGVFACGTYLFPPSPVQKEGDKALEFVQISAFVSAPPPPARLPNAPPEAPPRPLQSEAAVIKEESQDDPEPVPEPDIPPDEEPEPEENPQSETKPEEVSVNPNSSNVSTPQNTNTNTNMAAPGPERIFLPSIRVDTLPTYRKKAELEYPPAARRQNKEGRVIIEADIDENGHIVASRVLQKAGFGFDESALAMILASEFSPALVKGKPVAVRMRFTLDFRLLSTNN